MIMLRQLYLVWIVRVSFNHKSFVTWHWVIQTAQLIGITQVKLLLLHHHAPSSRVPTPAPPAAQLDAEFLTARAASQCHPQVPHKPVLSCQEPALLVDLHLRLPSGMLLPQGKWKEAFLALRLQPATEFSVSQQGKDTVASSPLLIPCQRRCHCWGQYLWHFSGGQ